MVYHTAVLLTPALGGWVGVACLMPVCPYQLSERYGPVFTVHLGSQKTVVLSGYEVVKEALVGTRHELADRPPIPIFQHIQRGGGRWALRFPDRWNGAWPLGAGAGEGQDQSITSPKRYDQG